MSSIKKNDKEEYFIYNKSLFMDFIDAIIDNTKTYIQPQMRAKINKVIQRSQNGTQPLTQQTRPSGHPEGN
jgi:hypothetical protein